MTRAALVALSSLASACATVGPAGTSSIGPVGARPAPRGSLETAMEQGPMTEARARAALAPHGRWEVDALGAVWVPRLPSSSEPFVPYVTHGSWVPSESGPRWASTVPWGPVTFGYGRWVPFGAGWAWRFGAAFDRASIAWRRAGASIGWGVFDFWCVVLADALYGPRASGRVIRGPEAAAWVASSVAIPAPDRTGPGLVVDLRGRRHDGGGRTVRAPDPPREDAEASQVEPGGAAETPRWATIVIRDQAAVERWQELLELEVTPGVEASPEGMVWDPGPRARPATIDASRARSAPVGVVPAASLVGSAASAPTGWQPGFAGVSLRPWGRRPGDVGVGAAEPVATVVPAVARTTAMGEANGRPSIAPAGAVGSGVWTGAGGARSSSVPSVTPAATVAPITVPAGPTGVGGAAWGGAIDPRAVRR